MVAFADTSFLASLYLEEATSKAADEALGSKQQPLPLTPLAHLELRNAFNRAIQRQRITPAERDALWQDVESDIASGFLVPTPVASADLHARARTLKAEGNRRRPPARVSKRFFSACDPGDKTKARR
ncbi:MAG: type II toxin-antitoxin system VapC family toxin [Verrucomicrobia bacterium]|nr:type II toxin-antitoxin system VapC family toxin [Verrucomicrobiota bacterium]